MLMILTVLQSFLNNLEILGQVQIENEQDQVHIFQ